MGKAIEYGASDSETIADLLGVSTRQLSNYIKQKDLPSHGGGRQRTFIWSEVREWYVTYRLSLDRNGGSAGNAPGDSGEGTSVPDVKHSEARRAKTMADLKELELQQRLGQVVDMQDVARILGECTTGLKTEILGLPSRIVEQVLVLRDRNELFTFLTAEASTLCTRLATLRIGSAEDLVDEVGTDSPPSDEDEIEDDE